MDGTTSVVAMIIDNKLITAHAGNLIFFLVLQFILKLYILHFF